MGETRHGLCTPLKIPADTEVEEVICLDSRHIIYTYSTTEALEDHNITSSDPNAYHTVYLRFSALCQVDDVHSIVVEVLHATMKVASNEGSWFTWQWDPTKA